MISQLLTIATLASVASSSAEPLPPYLPFVSTFDEGVHGCEGAAIPFVAAGRIKLGDGGDARGGVAHFHGHDPLPDGRARSASQKSAMVIEGVNVPSERGTVGFWLRLSDTRSWGDGKRSWVLVLLPSVANTMETKGKGTALTLFKDADNTLTLGVYQFHDGRVRYDLRTPKSGYEIDEPDTVPIGIPVGHLKEGEWAQVRVAWDRRGGRVWLGVNDTMKTSEVTLRDAPWHCLLLGTPPRIVYVEARGIAGDIDDLIVDQRTPAQTQDAGRERPKIVPPMAKAPNRKVPAKHLIGSPIGEKQESIVRSHLQNVVDLQQHGGWVFSTAWPSRMWFMSSKVVVPGGKRTFIGCKDGNSAFVALMLLAGYLTVGEPAYLEAAERTAQALMQLQCPDGHWPYAASFNPQTGKFEASYSAERAPLEDHVQSHPVTLLWLLHDLTGRPEYKAAADKGLAFILKAQNPNGSWSHHYNTKLACGQAARGHLRAGEINDDSTADQMMVALIAYRRTGQIKYLASYLRAADWLVSAFIDKKGKGWAQQYDEHNRPIRARHFEPDAISLSEGSHSAPLMLMQTYRMTGEPRYLEPVRKWKQWMWDNRVFLNEEKTAWGWHLYYDPEDGKPYRMVKGKKLPPDPRGARDGGFTGVLRRADRVERPVKRVTPSIKRAQQILQAVEGMGELENEPITNRLRALPLIESFDFQAGSWLYGHDIPWGPGFSCATVRVALVGWSVFLRRQVRGQIPIDHRMATLDREQWANPFYYLVPPAEMEKRLSPDEMRSARDHMAESPPA